MMMEIPPEYQEIINRIRQDEPRMADHLSDLDLYVLVQLLRSPLKEDEHFAFIVKGVVLADQAHHEFLLPPLEDLSTEILDRLGKKFLMESNLESAQNAYQVMVGKAQMASDLENVAKGMYGLGSIQTISGNSDQAIHYYSEALEVVKPLALYDFKGMIQQMMAMEYIQKGDFLTGLDFYKSAIQIYEKSGNMELGLWTKFNLATDYVRIHDEDHAIQIYKEVLGEFHSLGEDKGIENIYLNLGIAYQNRKNYDEAMDSLNSGLDVAARHTNWRGMCDIHQKLCEIQLILGNLNFAVDERIQMGNLQVMLGELKNAGKTYANVAIAQKLLGNIPNAVQYYTKALSLLEGENAKLEAAKVHFNLGYLYRSNQQEEMAEKSFIKAKEYFEELNDTENSDNASRLLAS